MEARGSFGIDPEEMTKLKRQIIASDKLLKKVNKLEKTLKTTEDALSEKEKEIVELKSDQCQSISSPKQRPEQKAEMEKLTKENEEKSVKVSQLEAQIMKYKSVCDKLEKEVKIQKQNNVKREIESQSLKKQLEEVEKSKKKLEEDLANGVQIQNMKEKIEEVRWSHQAEISTLKQEKASAENTVEELKKSYETVLKTKTDLAAQLESHKKQEKATEGLEKTIDKKEKQIQNLNKKLEQSRKENENLKLRLKNKGIVVERVEEEVLPVVDEEVSHETEDVLDLVETASTRKRFSFFSFSFSKPNSRFAIGRPQAPVIRARKFLFVKKASCVENIPVPSNRKPDLSFPYPNLSGESSPRAVKRKPAEPAQEVPSKRRKSVTVATLTPTKKRSGESPGNPKNSLSNKKKRTATPELEFRVEDSLEPADSETSPVAGAVSPVSSPPPSTGELFSLPNPVKSRQAHTSLSRPGISPLNKVKQKKTEAPTSTAAMRFEPSGSKKVNNNIFKLPPQLSPIKSPQVSSMSGSSDSPKTATQSSKAPTASSTASSTPVVSGAKAKILASGLQPLAIEPLTKSVGGKLNQAQLEAAKRRSVPASSVSQMPSVNGFRQSGKESKTSKKPEKKTLTVSDTDIYCPSRKRTNPVNLSHSVSEVPSWRKSSESSTPQAREEKFKSKEFVSTESESSAGEEAAASDDKTSGKVLSDDLEVSDSDEEPDSSKKVDPPSEAVEEGDERKERLSNLEEERGPQKVENNEKPKLVEASVLQALPERSRRIFKTQIEELVFNYKIRSDRNFQLLAAERDKLKEQRAGLMYEATVDLLRKHFGHLMGNQNEESFNKLVESIASSNNPQNEAMICDLVLEYLKTEHRDTPLMSDLDSDQPAITRKQQRLFTLLVSLSKLERYKNIQERMILVLWHNMFGRDRMFNHKLNAVLNYGRMFVLCARYSDNADVVKHFVYDLFFFKSPRNHLLVGIVVALWPQIFPKVSTDLAGTPLVETLVWCIFNTGPETFTAEMKVGETQENFERETGFKANSVKAESLVLKMIQLANENLVEDETLEEITKSLLVIGRCKGYRWVHNNIFTRLLKSLSQGVGTGGKEEFMTWVLSTIGLLSRIYPAEGRSSIKPIFESIESMLKNNELTSEMEAACVYALFQLGYHLQVQVAMFLKTWQPKHPLNMKTLTLMEDFVGTRGKNYATKTVQAVTTERNRLRKKGLVRPSKK